MKLSDWRHMTKRIKVKLRGRLQRIELHKQDHDKWWRSYIEY